MFVSPKQRTAAVGNSLLDAVSCPTSVVKANRWRHYKPRERSILWLPTGLFGKSAFLLDFTFRKMILVHLKSIPAGFCKLNSLWTKKALYSWLVKSSTYKPASVQFFFCWKYNGKKSTHAQTVCIRLRGGGASEQD